MFDTLRLTAHSQSLACNNLSHLQLSGALITGQGLGENPIFWIGEGVAVGKNFNVAVSNYEGGNGPA
jgi:fructose-1,6-bisphosphatase/sedoheptulose 1,7-bisphosphatase-like protein